MAAYLHNSAEFANESNARIPALFAQAAILDEENRDRQATTELVAQRKDQRLPYFRNEAFSLGQTLPEFSPQLEAAGTLSYFQGADQLSLRFDEPESAVSELRLPFQEDAGPARARNEQEEEKIDAAAAASVQQNAAGAADDEEMDFNEAVAVSIADVGFNKAQLTSAYKYAVGATAKPYRAALGAVNNVSNFGLLTIEQLKQSSNVESAVAQLLDQTKNHLDDGTATMSYKEAQFFKVLTKTLKTKSLATSIDVVANADEGGSERANLLSPDAVTQIVTDASQMFANSSATGLLVNASSYGQLKNQLQNTVALDKALYIPLK